jgi:hypothetical protein
VNIRKYIQRHILSPSKIALADCEAIRWSQRGCVKPQPNPILRGTYRNLGKPTGKEVASTILSFVAIGSHLFLKKVKHLRALTEFGKKHGQHPALLSDLKATYKWLNGNALLSSRTKIRNQCLLMSTTLIPIPGYGILPSL